MGLTDVIVLTKGLNKARLRRSQVSGDFFHGTGDPR